MKQIVVVKQWSPEYMATRKSIRASGRGVSVSVGGLPVVARVIFTVKETVTTERMTSLCVLALQVFTVIQIVSACKNCVILGKEEKAMFRAHSDACMSQSGVDPRLVEGLLSGRLEDRPSLRKHVYCVLLKCKLVGKDGKLMKSAVLGKMAMRMDARNASKVLENCSEQASEASSPEDVAWNLFRCGYDRKAVLFDYMPAGNLQQTN